MQDGVRLGKKMWLGIYKWEEGIQGEWMLLNGREG